MEGEEEIEIAIVLEKVGSVTKREVVRQRHHFKS